MAGLRGVDLENVNDEGFGTGMAGASSTGKPRFAEGFWPVLHGVDGLARATSTRTAS